MRCVVVLGRQGSGKGEQSRRLAERFGLEHVSTGDLLRAAAREGTPLGRACELQLVRGEPVADELVAGVVAARLAEAAVSGRGVVLDGYPRTVAQADRLAELLAPTELELALYLDVPRSVAVERIENRRVCTVCHRTNDHRLQCASCGGPTQRRADDEPAAIGRRMSDFAREAAPLLEWFDRLGRLVTVDGIGTPDAVAARVGAALDERLAASA